MKLLKMTLENFMAYASKTVEFGKRTTISGRNAAGKSSICNAYTWLLFNTDMDGNDNPDIRLEVDGKHVEDADVSVRAVFDMNGREVSLQKVQRRKYDKKDADKYADSNSYFINDVPKTLKEFNAFFDTEISTIRMCSNINAFLTKKDKEIREFLFSTVEDISDAEIAEKNGLKSLAERLKNYSKEEIEAMNKKVKSDTEKELPILKGQIAEKERDISIKGGFDTAELELAKKDLSERLRDNQRAQADVEEIRKQQLSAMDGVMEMRFQLNTMQTDANKELDKKRLELTETISKAREDERIAFDNIAKLQREIAELKADIETATKERKSLADDWQKVNAMQMDESETICPMCKRELPEDEIEQHKAKFDKNKSQRLAKIEERGNQLKNEIEQATIEYESKKGAIEGYKIKHEVAQDNRKTIQAALDTLPRYADMSENEEYNALKAKMEQADRDAKQHSYTDAMQALKGKENQLRAELQEVSDKIANADSSADEKRLDELQELYRTKEQVKADAECILDMLKELDRAKNETLSTAINSKFNLVQWRLWELNKSGGYKNTCIPMIDGKSILTIKSNKGNRFLGRLDICESLQKITGISCPIWIDDCESLDKANREKASEMVDGQLIMMVVSDDILKVEVM